MPKKKRVGNNDLTWIGGSQEDIKSKEMAEMCKMRNICNSQVMKN
jgi:hypothetical protein